MSVVEDFGIALESILYISSREFVDCDEIISDIEEIKELSESALQV